MMLGALGCLVLFTFLVFCFFPSCSAAASLPIPTMQPLPIPTMLPLPTMLQPMPPTQPMPTMLQPMPMPMPMPPMLLPLSVRAPKDAHYRQVGVLSRVRGDGRDVTNSDLDLLPLMGQWLRNDRWRYFTRTGGIGNLLPVERRDGCGGNCGDLGRLRCGDRRRNCTSEQGCTELEDGDAVVVPGFHDAFVVVK